MNRPLDAEVVVENCNVAGRADQEDGDGTEEEEGDGGKGGKANPSWTKSSSPLQRSTFVTSLL